MGLEFSVFEFKKMGWKPVAVFLLATLFNTILALGVTYVIFTFLLPSLDRLSKPDLYRKIPFIGTLSGMLQSI